MQIRQTSSIELLEAESALADYLTAMRYIEYALLASEKGMDSRAQYWLDEAEKLAEC